MSKSGMGELVSEVARLSNQIEALRYYDFLAVTPRTDYIGIRDAFYSRAQLYHTCMPGKDILGEIGPGEGVKFMHPWQALWWLGDDDFIVFIARA